jgi:hypothetical protein
MQQLLNITNPLDFFRIFSYIFFRMNLSTQKEVASRNGYQNHAGKMPKSQGKPSKVQLFL